MGTLLEFLAAESAADLHPLGKDGSRVLFQALDLGRNDHVLEIGCGTGASLVRAAAAAPASLTGTDVAEDMLAQARRRLDFCGLGETVQLVRHTPGERLRFSPQSHTAIYAEGVLASLERDVLLPLLEDVHRCLAPGGRFAAIELLWRPETDSQTAARIESGYRDTFGDDFVRAESSHDGILAALFDAAGFSSVRLEEAAPLAAQLPPAREHALLGMSDRFSRACRRRRGVSPSYWIQRLRFRQAFQRHASDFRHMRPVLITARRGAGMTSSEIRP